MTYDHELKATISNNILFNGLDQSVLRTISTFLKRQIVEQQSILYHQGDMADGLYLIYSGMVQIFTQRDNELQYYIEANQDRAFDQTIYLFGLMPE